MSPHNNGTDLVLYCHPTSFYSQKVIMSLYQKKLKFRPVFVDIKRGRQFNDKFLALNPKGEVPVLVDDMRVIPDSEHIMNYLEDNFSNGTPRLRPQDHDLRQRVEQLHQMIHGLNVTALSFGSIIYEDLNLNPKEPYNNLIFRSQMKSMIENRVSSLQSQIQKHPNHAVPLQNKLNEIEQNKVFWEERKKYLDLILSFEKVMDEIEAELQIRTQEGDHKWWLCSPQVSTADIDLSILLHRLYQLGFESRMWKNRPFIARYFARVQQLDSFQQATHMKERNGISDLISSPVFWGVLGVFVAAAGGVYLWNKQGETLAQKLVRIFGNDNNSVTRDYRMVVQRDLPRSLTK